MNSFKNKSPFSYKYSRKNLMLLKLEFVHYLNAKCYRFTSENEKFHLMEGKDIIVIRQISTNYIKFGLIVSYLRR